MWTNEVKLEAAKKDSSKYFRHWNLSQRNIKWMLLICFNEVFIKIMSKQQNVYKIVRFEITEI